MSENVVESKKRGLGRGLGSLLGGENNHVNPAQGNIQQRTVPTQQLDNHKKNMNNQLVSQKESVIAVSEGKIWQLSVEKIKSGIYQPRRVFEKTKIEELAQSIKQNGMLQPIVVRKKDGVFEIVAGERRWRAAQAAGLHEVPVIIKNYNDKETLELAIVENIQREDLNPLEEAEGYFRLMNEFSLSHQQIAEKVGKERATVTNAIRLLSLPIEIKKMLEESGISVGHAKVLLGIEDREKQLFLANLARSEKLSVRNLEKAAQQKNNKNKDEDKNYSSESNVTQRLIGGLSEELQKLLGTRVNIEYHNSKGKISINFYSDEELTNLVDRLKRGCQT